MSDPAALTVDGAPVITADPQNVTTEAGKEATFTVQATGTGLTYQWQQQVNGSWVDMPGETADTLTVSATTENSGSVYRCKVTSSYGTTVTSDTVTLTVVAKVELPQTGDASRPWLWLTLMCASLLGLTILRRRHA